MNGLNNFTKTDREYSLALVDDLIRFGGQRFKGQGHNWPKYVAANAATSMPRLKSVFCKNSFPLRCSCSVELFTAFNSQYYYFECF